MKLLFPFLIFVFIASNLYAGKTDSISHVVEVYLENADPSLPPVNVLIEENITDVSICKGPNKTYFLTGTSGEKNGVQTGLKVWASKDLTNWNSIGTDGYVWTFKRDGASWQKKISIRNGWRQRGIVAPKIYYLKNNFWITYTISNSNKSGILKSISGWAQGPYIDLGGELPLIDGVRASLFMDSDSTVYVLWGRGNIKKLNTEQHVLVGNQQQLLNSDGRMLSEQINQLQKINGKYVVSMSIGSSVLGIRGDQSSSVDYRDDASFAVSDRLLGAYRIQSTSIPHGGAGWLFSDFQNNYHFIFSGNDPGSPVAENPCLLSVKIDDDTQVGIKHEMSLFPKADMPVVFVSPVGNNSTGGTWDNAYTTIQRAIDNAPDNCQIWIAEGRYDGPIRINLRYGLYIYGGFKGDEETLDERDTDVHKVIIDGRRIAKHVVAMWTSNYIRIEGITFQGGKADNGSFHLRYGGGMHILGGGETIRIVNCEFKDNYANQDGGAFYASVGAAPVVIGCTFKDNTARNNGGAVSVYSNGMNGYHAKFINCKFENNNAQSRGGAIYFDSNQQNFGLLTLLNCLFVNNTAREDGGIINMDRNTNLILYNSTLIGNRGTSNGAVIAGLGKVPAHSRIVNCIFSENKGGTLFSIEGEAETEKTEDRLIVRKQWIEISNCLFDNNKVNALVQRNFDRKSWLTVDALNESVIGANCKVGNPAFANVQKGDYSLQNSSDARGAGTASFGFLPFNIEGVERPDGKVSIGCY